MNQYILQGKSNQVARYSLYKLKLAPNAELGDKIDEGKTGLDDHIFSYDPKQNKYSIKYEGSDRRFKILPTALRRGNPTRLSLAEVAYWNQHGGRSGVPEKFKSLLPH
jgi:hypothetical protein